LEKPVKELDLSLTGALELGSRELVALVGGGGKTSALLILAEELAGAGRKVLVTTTTRIYRRQFSGCESVMAGSYPQLLKDLKQALKNSSLVAAGKGIDLVEEKVLGLPSEWLDLLWQAGIADYLLVEADGSRGKSLKAPAGHEPAIPSAATLVVAVIGMDVLGKPLEHEFVHRPELVARAAGVIPGSLVDTEVVSRLAIYPEGPGKNVPPGARRVFFINKVDGSVDLPLAGQLVAVLSIAGGWQVVLGSCRNRYFLRPAFS